ncbi:MAG TPA: hypothetical protein VIO39_01950 [Methylotenera sp.]
MRINIAKEMAVCVKRLGGVVLDEVLEQPNFANADYWFKCDDVVAELKCLTEDLSSKSEFNASVASMYASWVKRGLIPNQLGKPVSLNLQDIPQKCAREFLDPIKKRIEASTIKKANQQIKETKKYFKSPNAKGLLLLVNDGNYMLPPNMMAHMLARILKEQHSSINSVIYFSVNELSEVPGILMPSLFWIDALIPNREPVRVDFRQALRAEWMRHHSSLIPDQLFEIEGSTDPEFVNKIQFVKNMG